MQREIKFRLWHPEFKADGYVEPAWMDYDPDWQNVSVVRYEKKVEPGLIGEVHSKLERARLNKIFAESTLPLMQYTGFHDKKGKEIYEGDVVAWHEYWATYIGQPPLVKGFVKFAEGSWQTFGAVFDKVPLDTEIGINMASAYSGKTREFEIIGNIYENPELLNR